MKGRLKENIREMERLQQYGNIPVKGRLQYDNNPVKGGLKENIHVKRDYNMIYSCEGKTTV